MTRRTLVPALLGSAFVIVLAGAATAGSLPETAPDEFANLPQVSSDELAQLRGGEELLPSLQLISQLNNVDVDISQNNPINGNITNGAISGNSIHDVRGISTVMYNTGNNVVFNSATQLNITFK